MESYLIACAVPVFFLLIGIEYYVMKRRRQSFYDAKDFANNLSTGVLEQTLSTPAQIFLLVGYQLIYQHAALFAINPKSILAWLALWIGVDFCYYWFHRASHRITFLWIGHSVHHQSERYNLSVALRQGVLQAFCAPVIYWPLALIGFPTWMMLTTVTLNTLYQFWIHTQTIHKMGWFELIFNTPSHHRVHHGRNAKYIDKNYAGSLIIWDKLFGTFEPETVPADYGVTEPLETWNPFYANIKVAMDMRYYGQFLKSLPGRLLLFLKPPEAIVGLLGKQQFDQVKRHHTPNQQPVSIVYLLVNVGLMSLSFVFFLLNLQGPMSISLLCVSFILLTMLLIGMISNGSRYTLSLEVVRGLIVVAWLYQLVV